MARVEREQARQEARMESPQLHLEDIDDRGSSNNLRIRGLLESEDNKDLDTTITALF